MVLDSWNTHFRERSLPRFISMRVHRDDPSHENNIGARFASVFSWRFFFVFGERSPSLTYFMRVIVFRGRSPSWTYFVRVMVFRERSPSWNYFVRAMVFRERSPSWAYFVRVIIFRESSPSRNHFVRVLKLTGNIVSHESTPSRKIYPDDTKVCFHKS